MKFAHFADCHLGGWREPRMRNLNFKAFEKTISEILSKNVDFVIIAGDLFNTSLPAIDIIKDTVVQLKRFKEKNIKVYAVAGSHDFSPSGKTMLDVLEKAELLVNVAKGKVEGDVLKLIFTEDEKTKVKITGLPGKKGMLEQSFYKILDKKSLENIEGEKIFVYHTALTEFNELKMDSMALAFLPKGFTYYAGGHVHYGFCKAKEDYGTVCMPGPVFPNSFKEIEELENGGYYIFENGKADFFPVKIKEIMKIEVDCSGKTADQILEEALKSSQDVLDKIILLRFKGNLDETRIIDIKFKEIYDTFYNNGAYFVMRNATQVKIQEMEEINVDFSSVDQIEEEIISEKESGQKIFENEKEFVRELMKILDKEQQIGSETKGVFEERILSEFKVIMNKNKFLKKQ